LSGNSRRRLERQQMAGRVFDEGLPSGSSKWMAAFEWLETRTAPLASLAKQDKDRTE
jgi:hypothetical protein